MVVGRDELRTVLDSELRVSAFKDYCPNGLQVEGRNEINVLVSGVTACQALLDRAVALERTLFSCITVTSGAEKTSAWLA